MKNIIRLLVCVGVLATPQLLSAEQTCTDAYGDCNNPAISASDVETCWFNDGTGEGELTIIWCDGTITTRHLYGGGGGSDHSHIPNYNNTGRN